MPKRQASGVNKPELPPATITLFERWDTEALASIRELAMIPAIESVVETIAGDFVHAKGELPPTFRKVPYRPAEFKEGRLYGTGLQSCPGFVRRICAHKYYHDIDIANASPTLICQLMEKETGSCPAMLLEYMNDRDGVFQRLREEEPTFADLTYKKMKKMFLVMLHGGSHQTKLAKYGLGPQPVPLLAAFEKAIATCASRLMLHTDYQKILADIKADPSKTNIQGTFISHCWQIVENKCMLALTAYLTTKKIAVGALNFDGLMCERQAGGLTPDFLRGCESAIHSATGYHVKLLEKSLVPTPEDLAKYWGEKAIQKIKDVELKQIYLLSQAGKELGAMRRDGWVMLPHQTIRGVYVQHVESDAFINRVTQDYPNIR